MYESFYGFAEKPFNLTPDPKYLYLSARHTEAFAHLEFGRRERGGFVVITGEVGTGKTTLARYFLSSLKDAATAVVLYPALTAAELLRSILDDLHATPRGESLKDLVDALHEFLLASRARNRNVVLIIDEAQDLSPEVLEQVRLISNLETDTEKLIQIILMGQTELKELLDRRELRQLAQRVTARYHLAPLGRQETEAYVRHRLQVAGGEGKVVFTPGALLGVHRESGGLPRLINLICDRALLAGYVQGSRTILPPMVRRAASEVRGDTERPRVSRSLLVAGIGALVLAALWFLRGELARPSSVAAAPPPSLPQVTIPPPTTTLAPLDPLLLTVDRAASLRQATADIEALWGPGPLVATPFRTHLAQVRRFDLPAALEMFHPSRRDTCYLALIRLDGDAAVVGDGRGGTQRVAVRDLDQLWTRQATLMWRDSLSAAADAARTGQFARDSLGRLGYLEAGGDLTAAVARFQRDTELAPDGIIGQRTLLALYSLGPHEGPRLSGGSS
ncbi:MAG TPA: AAA family ATPase [Vicinamibacteria bacterium]|nr:AAA family ATPase [Vicinamibacteria bacterium]